MDLYFTRHDGEAATVEQFVQCFADASNRDLSQFMRWYSQAGTPEVMVTGSHDAGARTYRLETAQTVPPTPGQPSKQPMVIPLVVGLVGKDGRDLPLRRADGEPVERSVLTLSKDVETFVFTDIDEPPVPSLNRGFSAPIKLVANLSGNDLRFLAARDSDPFNRWQAVQTLATRLLVGNVAALRAGRAVADDEGLLQALAAVLADRALEPAFVAQTLAMPSEADIAREIGRDVDPDAVFRARTSLRRTIGSRLGPALEAAYTALTQRGPYSPDAASAGKRSLRNVCLDLLAADAAPQAVERAARQYECADNMTDRMAALATLSLHPAPQRDAAFDDFYRRYADDPLITDKWLALQAGIPEPATLERVRTLTRHPAFSFANPNRVRALIGSFAQGNQTQFNRPDGAGYRFVVETARALDPKNPQVTARLMTAFKSWRALEPQRRAHAEAALRQLAEAPSLSRDTADIVQRALAENGD
jgi:aminopeptidase N